MTFTKPKKFPLPPEGFFVYFLCPGAALVPILETGASRVDSLVLSTAIGKWVGACV